MVVSRAFGVGLGGTFYYDWALWSFLFRLVMYLHVPIFGAPAFLISKRRMKRREECFFGFIILDIVDLRCSLIKHFACCSSACYVFIAVWRQWYQDCTERSIDQYVGCVVDPDCWWSLAVAAGG